MDRTEQRGRQAMIETVPQRREGAQTFSVCVFCGSQYGESAVYQEAAAALGHAMAREGWRLVYGAGNCGLMGEVATCVMKGGGDVFGVIPTHLPEQLMPGLAATVFTCNMNERKNVMLVNSDAFVVLPGGLGTLDEMFEILTLRKLGQHAKPIRILNIDGFWNAILDGIDKLVDEGFVSNSSRQLFRSFETVTDLVDCLQDDARSYHDPH